MRRTYILPLCFLLLFLVALGILTDYSEAARRGGSFYLSESFSYKIFWLLFLPFVLGVFSFSDHFGPKKRIHTWLCAIGGIAVISGLHILLTASILSWSSPLFSIGPIRFGRILSYFFREELSTTLIMYAGIFALSFRSEFRRIAAAQVREPDYPEFLLISENRKQIPVAVKHIRYIRTDRPYIAIYTNGRKYLYSSSLKAMAERLDPRKFVRIHRSTIVHVAFVQTCTSRSNGDYDILMRDGSLLRMSRNYRQAFQEACRI